jgi:hypothetical protein
MGLGNTSLPVLDLVSPRASDTQYAGREMPSASRVLRNTLRNLLSYIFTPRYIIVQFVLLILALNSAEQISFLYQVIEQPFSPHELGRTVKLGDSPLV